MSRVSSRKCSDPGARVQAPFTLSDTSTCPGSLYWENHPTSRSPPATGLVSVTVVVRTRSPVENAVPWTKVGLVAWPTAGRARRAARAAITARRAPDGAEGKSFMVIYSFTKREWRERELAWDSTRLHVEREVALRVASNRRAGDPSPFSRAVFEAPERNVGIGKSGRVRRGVAGPGSDRQGLGVSSQRSVPVAL